jgi:hypothetical protein
MCSFLEVFVEIESQSPMVDIIPDQRIQNHISGNDTLGIILLYCLMVRSKLTFVFNVC